jgi:large subunit ribosomal protein L23
MTGKDPRDVIIKPVVSEKSYAAYDENVYTFIVAHDANKIEIRKAVEDLFGKKVSKVHTINRKGKRKRNRRTGTFGTRATQKRAIVTLAAGEERIDIFGS